MAVKDESRIIELSLKIALFKIILSLFFTLIIQDNSKYIMLSFLCGLLLSTVVYEFARSKNIKYLIFLTVGTGYPLRFFLGFFAIVPVNLSFGVPMICIILSFFAFGSFSSIISWTNEVTDRIQEKNSGIERDDYTFIGSFEKQHYTYLQDKIKQRYILASNHPYGEKILPLREKGNLYDPWNVLFLFSMVMLSLAIGFHISCKYIILEIIFNLLCIINIYVKRISKLIFFILLWITTIVKLMLNISMIVYVLISGLQMLIISTYFVLCYRPQIKKIDLHILIKKAKNLVLVLIIGENAAKMLKK